MNMTPNNTKTKHQKLANINFLVLYLSVCTALMRFLSFCIALTKTTIFRDIWMTLLNVSKITIKAAIKAALVPAINKT